MPKSVSKQVEKLQAEKAAKEAEDKRLHQLALIESEKRRVAATLKVHGLMTMVQDEQKKVDMRQDIISKLRKEVGKTTLETM